MAEINVKAILGATLFVVFIIAVYSVFQSIVAIASGVFIFSVIMLAIGMFKHNDDILFAGVMGLLFSLMAMAIGFSTI